MKHLIYDLQERAALKLTKSRGGIVWWKVGCLDTDTELFVKQGFGNRRKRMSIYDLYQKFSKRRNEQFLRSHLNGKTFWNKIVDVYASGLKDCLLITFSNGQQLKCSYEHRIMLPDETFLQACKLQVNDMVLACGDMLCYPQGGKKKGQKRERELLLKFHPIGYEKIVNGCFYRRVQYSRIVYESSLNCIPFTDFVFQLQNNIGIDKLKFVPKGIDIHHKDENPLNNDPDNLVEMSHEDHARHHMELDSNLKYNHCRVVKVNSIEKIGKCRTFDIEMEKPADNFEADGIFVHNSGKTRIALYWWQLMIDAMKWQCPDILLVVSRRKAFYDWEKEIRACLPGVDVYVESCPAHPPHRSVLLVSEGMFCKLATWLRTLPIRAVVYDELWLYSNHKSAKSQAVQLFSIGRRALGLSGSIMKAKNTLEVYSQAMAVQKHRIVADSPTKFRGQYQMCINIGFPKYYPRPGAYQKLMNRLEFCTDIHFPKGNRLIHDQYHDIPATPQQLKYFKELKEFYSVEDVGLELNNALALVIKAQQIANGWVKTAEGRVVRINTNKIAKLIEELESILAGGDKVIVWCAFREDIKILAEELPFATVQMLGGTDFDLDRWKSPDVNVCLATVGSGSSVNHFEQCPYAIYFSSDFKWKNMQQTRGRTDRKSSRHSDCFYKYLQVDSSLDSHVYRTVMESGDRENILIKIGEVAEWIKT